MITDKEMLSEVVYAVLLIDGWHHVQDQSFMNDTRINWYRWKEYEGWTICPFESIIALRMAQPLEWPPLPEENPTKPSQLTHSQPLTDTQNNP